MDNTNCSRPSGLGYRPTGCYQNDSAKIVEQLTPCRIGTKELVGSL